MMDLFQPAHWAEIVRAGGLNPAPPKRLAGGNADRRADNPKQIFLADRADGAAIKLTIGKDLSELVSRTESWAGAFPTFGQRPLQVLRIGGWHILIESYFAGVTLWTALNETRGKRLAAGRAFARLAKALAGTRLISTEEAREAEWQEWCRSLLELSDWTASEIEFLRDQLLPLLAEHLRRDPPERQWVHGDLTDENFLVNDRGDACLIDPEYSCQTHFFPAELVRFYCLSKAASEQPGMFSATCPIPDQGWQIFFWLTQVVREAKANTSDYNQKWRSHRLGTIRQLAVPLFAKKPLAWPWEKYSAEIPSPHETAQFFWLSGRAWNEERSFRGSYHRDRVQYLQFPLPDPEGPWRFDPSTNAHSSEVRRITVHGEDAPLSCEYSGVGLHGLSLRPLEKTHLEYTPSGIILSAEDNDPQFVFSIAAPLDRADWIEIEVVNHSKPLTACRFQLEEQRWVTQPNPVSIRITGWCLPPVGIALARIEARFNGEPLAASALSPRPDVQAHHGTDVALSSGFILEIPGLHARDFVELVAVSTVGISFPLQFLQAGDLSNCGPLLPDYATWGRFFDGDRRELPTASTLKFSILLPVFNPEIHMLRECLASVQTQTHLCWELVIVDDHSTAAGIDAVLAAAEHEDQRITVQRRALNAGIAVATNQALEKASGDFVVMLDHDDILRSHALAEIAQKIAATPTLDVIYSDEDKISSDGHRTIPFLKPDFSPEYLLGVMYVGHVLCVRTTLARAVGGFDSHFDGIQDYEFFLRLTENTRRIAHLARILYHWRQSPNSSALVGNVKGDMDRKHVAAVQAHLERRKDPRQLVPLGRHRLRVAAGTRVVRTTIILDWESVGVPDDCDWAGLVAEDCDIHVSSVVTVPPNFPRIVCLQVDDVQKAVRDLASRHGGIFVLFRRPPAQLSPGWLKELAAMAALPDSGCVAPLLISREGKILESGRTFNATGATVPLMSGFDPDGDGYNGVLCCSREVAAVSPLCVALRAELVTSTAENFRLNWLSYSRVIQARGFFHRICAPSRIHVSHSWREHVLPDHPPSVRVVDSYYNSQFDRERGDYTLANVRVDPAVPETVFAWFVDRSPPDRCRDGCLTLTGWCFGSDKQRVTMEIAVAGIQWTALCDQSRPDVVACHPEVATRRCGFTFTLRLPVGSHTLRLSASSATGKKELLFSRSIIVPRSAEFRWLLPQTENHLTFQIMPSPTQGGRPLRPEIFPRARSTANTWPKFSIVTPSYQHARFLAETMRSVTEQPKISFAYRVQDGGSTDGSVEIIRQHADRLSAWESVPDGGQGDAILRAFKGTIGQPTDVMAWLNSDDYYLPGALAYVADFLARHPHVDVVYGHRVLVDEKSEEVGRWFVPAHDPEILTLNDYVPQETVFWRRRIWDIVGGIDPNLKFAMDWDLLLRFQAAGAKIVRVPYFLACFRIHSAQKTSAQMKSIGHGEIDALRLRTFGRVLSPQEIETHPRMIRYLRKSAWMEFLWRRLGIRHP